MVKTSACGWQVHNSAHNRLQVCSPTVGDGLSAGRAQGWKSHGSCACSADEGELLPRFLWLRSGASPLLSLMPHHPEALQKRQLEGRRGIHSPLPCPAGAREQGWAAARGPLSALNGPRVLHWSPALPPSASQKQGRGQRRGEELAGPLRRPSSQSGPRPPPPGLGTQLVNKP